MEEIKYEFVTYLEGKRDHSDQAHSRSVMAALRRGLGQPLGSVIDMYPYVVPWLPKESYHHRDQAYYLTASLFAYHPEPGGSGTMGNHFADVRDQEQANIAIERRFTALLAAHPEDFSDYLRQAVSFLQSKKVPVNWHRLFRDITKWSNPEKYVQREWARDFWTPAPETNPEQTENLSEEA